MEHQISDLVGRFERGKLSRRELVQALAMIVAGGAAAQAAPLKSATINHTSVLVSLRVDPPAGTIDHFAIGVEGFNKEAVTRELQAMGLTPKENLEYGFYVDDPDGAHV